MGKLFVFLSLSHRIKSITSRQKRKTANFENTKKSAGSIPMHQGPRSASTTTNTTAVFVSRSTIRKASAIVKHINWKTVWAT